MSASSSNDPRNGGPGTEGRRGPEKILGKESLAKPLVKRFFTTASVGEAAPFQILLDGKPIKTPKKKALAVPTLALAQAIASEWSAQRGVINPAQMPLTRFANTAIDAVSETLDAVAGDIVAYAGRDLLCYRAVEPDLAQLQAARWDPVLAWARVALGATFTVVQGVMPVDQSAGSLGKVAAALEPHEAFHLTGLHVLTTLSGSALLALALVQGFLDARDAWAAANVDEDYQIGLWGEDAEATVRRAARTAEFEAASRLLALLK